MEYLILLIKILTTFNFAVYVLSKNVTAINAVDNNNKETYKSKTSFPKCCGNKEYVNNNKSCTPESSGQNFTEIAIYGKTLSNREIVGKLSDFRMKTGRFEDEMFLNNSVRLPKEFIMYLTEDGMLHCEIPNTAEDMKWFDVDPSMFCVDYFVKDDQSAPYVEYWYSPDQQEQVQYDDDTDNLVFHKTGQAISSICLLLVLLVYSAFPELRSIGGLIIMGYVSSLLVSFLFLIIMGTVDPTPIACRVLTFLLYFSLLSSFCWTNVMSFDICWTFSGYADARSRQTRWKFCRFLIYSLYGLGVPLLMTIGLGILDAIDSYVNIPGFIAPKIHTTCFLADNRKMLYLSTPMLIMIMINWALFIITVVKLIRFHKGNAVLDQQSHRSVTHRTLKNRLILYFKLSVVMGLSWVFEFISFIIPDAAFLYITDAYNLLTGVWIFFILICKRKIYSMIVKKFGKNGRRNQSNGRKKTISQDSISKTLLTVSSDPGMQLHGC